MAPGATCILGQTPYALEQWLAAEGAPAYRLKQILKWIYEARVASFDEMTNLPKALRERLAACHEFPTLDEVDRQRSADGRTEKFLLQLADGEQIEAVSMEDEKRTTFCISSQAGCKMGCTFCATGRLRFGRDLTTGEILGQVTALARACGDLRSVVLMGMGEPLMNLRAVFPALDALNDDARLALGARRLTVSTAGVTPGIAALAKHSVKPNLALSLNSPFDEQRSELMPVNRTYPLAGVLGACGKYAKASGRRLLLEYVLLKGVNMSGDHVRELARIGRDLRALINLIPFNPVPDSGFHPCDKDDVYRFKAALEKNGAAVTVRFRRGREIVAGCGQLVGRRPPKE